MYIIYSIAQQQYKILVPSMHTSVPFPFQMLTSQFCSTSTSCMRFCSDSLKEILAPFHPTARIADDPCLQSYWTLCSATLLNVAKLLS